MGSPRPISQVVNPQRDREPTTDISTSEELIGDLRALFNSIDEAHDEAVRCANEYAQAEYEYEIAYASARLTAEAQGGTAGAKDASARQSTAVKKRDLTLAQELRRSARDAEENIRHKMSALQTIAAAFRAELELAGRGPRST